jgi:hypothetical protein
MLLTFGMPGKIIIGFSVEIEFPGPELWRKEHRHEPPQHQIWRYQH